MNGNGAKTAQFNLQEHENDAELLTAAIVAAATDAVNYVLVAWEVPEKHRALIDALIGASNGEPEWFEAIFGKLWPSRSFGRAAPKVACLVCEAVDSEALRCKRMRPDLCILRE